MKQKNTRFRNFISSVVDIFRRPKTRTYRNPVLPRVRSHNKKKKVIKPLPCEPGTIVYRDWLVRELGYDRRLADGYLYAFRNGYSVKMPMPSDLAAV
jgi:hypothetical protein